MRKYRWLYWVVIAACCAGVIASLAKGNWAAAAWAGCTIIWVAVNIQAEKLLEIKDEYIDSTSEMLKQMVEMQRNVFSRPSSKN